jgi:hypothetical protein
MSSSPIVTEWGRLVAKLLNVPEPHLREEAPGADVPHVGAEPGEHPREGEESDKTSEGMPPLVSDSDTEQETGLIGELELTYFLEKIQTDSDTHTHTHTQTRAQSSGTHTHTHRKG